MELPAKKQRAAKPRSGGVKRQMARGHNPAANQPRPAKILKPDAAAAGDWLPPAAWLPLPAKEAPLHLCRRPYAVPPLSALNRCCSAALIRAAAAPIRHPRRSSSAAPTLPPRTAPRPLVFTSSFCITCWSCTFTSPFCIICWSLTLFWRCKKHFYISGFASSVGVDPVLHLQICIFYWRCSKSGFIGRRFDLRCCMA